MSRKLIDSDSRGPVLAFASLFVLIAAAVLCHISTEGYGTPPTSANIVAYTNQYRGIHGLPALTETDQMDSVATTEGLFLAKGQPTSISNAQFVYILQEPQGYNQPFSYADDTLQLNNSEAWKMLATDATRQVVGVAISGGYLVEVFGTITAD